MIKEIIKDMLLWNRVDFQGSVNLQASGMGEEIKKEDKRKRWHQ